MSYIFRLHKEGGNTLTDWGNSSKYGTNVIDQIKDPNGESAKREITSIPSPFARIDLVKTAFGKVAIMGVDGRTIHHKMVSDAFDIGQLFFEYDKFADKFEIFVWDKKNHLKELLESPYPEHQQLGKTYDIFLQQDGAMYNFDRMDRMYLLNFKNGPEMTNIIGATSPATLFFTSANDLDYVADAIRFGSDKPFDDNYTPLYKRDLEYQKFWYLLRIVNRDFVKLFPEVNKYLDESFKKLTAPQQKEIRDLQAKQLDTYSDVKVNGDAGNAVFVINGILMKQRVLDTNQIAGQSGFLIDSPFLIEGKKPLVLPLSDGQAKYTKATFYASGVWDANTIVPYYDPDRISDRILPEDGSKYPYLTISDFLTDTLVCMPYEINRENFFDGNINKPDGNSYLLPLTDTFFLFFSAKYLTDKVMSDNRKMFELQVHATGVTAVLRVPVRSGYIEYRRTYFEGLDANETKSTNDGVLLEKKFGLGIMPLIRFPENVDKHYRIAMFDRGKNDVVLTCVEGNSNIETKQVIREKKQKIGTRDICSSESYIVEANFDRIRVKVGNVADGFIVPDFKVKDGNAQYTFAIDFGTTNTHIEYCTHTNTNPVAFNITANEQQLNKLHIKYGADKDIATGFIDNFIPDTVGDSEYSFPMRTVFSQHKNVNYDQTPMPLADGNIPFLYEKERTPGYNETKTDLKWGGVPDRLLEMHLETIFILMRNKVALNSGDLASTKVVWFYPASMTEAKVNQFKKNWKNAYIKYFGDNVGNVISISESTAPYSYYSKKKGARTEVVTIDVGGGTTDVFVVENRIPQMLLSFRFASNAIFGDGYNWDSDNNGFVNLYKNRFEEMLTNNHLEALKQALNQIESQKKSSDIVAFLFSLIGDKVKNNPSLNFLQQLSGNDRMRYVFIVFYAAILYFIAKSMKAKGLKKPLTLAFSGNGSHSLRIVSDEEDMIARFAQLIFDGVYADGNKGQIQVIMEEEPKKATCKGGIINPVSQDYETIENIKTILTGDNFNTFSEERITYADITPKVEKGVLQSVKDFFNFLFNLHKNNNDFLSNKLAADPSIYTKVKEICLNETTLSQSLSDGLYHKRQEVTDETKVEETLFFYPLIGVLHDLALKISEM
jgi:hypothetical protein